MSATGSLGDLAAPARSERLPATGSWAAFCVLALYGTARWGTMLQQHAQGRLYLGLLLAILNAIALRRLPRRGNRDWLIPVLCVVDVALVLMIAGFPTSWVIGGHWGRLGSALSDGISNIPGVLVPYTGNDPNTAAVIVLGAGALLLCGGLAFGNVRGRPASGQLLLAALPLLALAIVPSAIVRPEISFVHGVVTFTLVALLVLSPRLSPSRRGGGAALLATAAIVGAIIAGVVAGNGRPWLRVATGHAVAKGVTDASGDGIAVFNWSQTYGPLGPGSSAAVMTIKAKRPLYWKSEDLDVFNGRSWTMGNSSGDGLNGVTPAHLHQYREEISVAVTDMESNQVIAAGYASHPNLLGVVPGDDPGTWLTTTPLDPGTSYTVEVYSPDPTTAQLADTGRTYPAALDRFRGVNLPGNAYAGVQSLAERLQAGTRTPIGYVDAVLDYLQNTSLFTYTLHPPKGGRYPLVTFLLDSHKGYCQQFAGAMALLLRLGGVPARVAVGFNTGNNKKGSNLYTVSGKNAHAWVEAWFPQYGWVTFDPTPGQPVKAVTSTTDTSTTPAGSSTGSTSTPAGSSTGPAHTKSGLNAGRLHGLGDGGGPVPGTSGGGVSVLAILGGLLGAGLLVFLARLLIAYARRPTVADLAAELEPAFARCGQPLGRNVTLSALGLRLRDSPTAEAYIRSLAASRFERGGGVPTARGRAALRRRLASGRGPLGVLRAFQALPPRRSPR